MKNLLQRSLARELQQLIAEKTEYCTVDTAYEAVDSMEASGDSESLDRWWETVNTSYDGNNVDSCVVPLSYISYNNERLYSPDEVDELDSNLTLTCTTIDIICELLAGIASCNTLQQEAVVRWAKLLIGNISEPILQVCLTKKYDVHFFIICLISFSLALNIFTENYSMVI